ncbi:MAG TPA: GNAT family N-acetyltransferase [Phycisphaerae bacterium]|nr:GNAT family N-acetyltransferase [Phycisphaerae bacterium]HUT57362.1 GNAT family N-acetyltransferase [Phycisphaerae bacterium]
MSVVIEQIGPDRLAEYAGVSPEFEVRRALDVIPVRGGLGGLELREAAVGSPYSKGADEPGDEPACWLEKEKGPWGFFLARDGDRPVGACAVVINPSAAFLFERRGELAGLWDIRVAPDRRRQGVGAELLRRAADWARAHGCEQLRIETQNVNVPACRFYAKQGCVLGSIHRFAYANRPDVAHETMLLWYLDL